MLNRVSLSTTTSLVHFGHNMYLQIHPHKTFFFFNNYSREETICWNTVNQNQNKSKFSLLLNRYKNVIKEVLVYDTIDNWLMSSLNL